MGWNENTYRRRRRKENETVKVGGLGKHVLCNTSKAGKHARNEN
jgi:hypothetical protein